MPEKGFLAWLEGNRFAHRHPELWKYVKFFLVGAVTALPDWGSYMLSLYALRALGAGGSGPLLDLLARVAPPTEGFSVPVLVYAYMISTTIGYTCAFILNRKATFHADSNVALSTALYVLMVIFTVFANGLVVGPFVSGLVGRLGLPPLLSEAVSKVPVMAIPGLWTYPLSRFVIHRKKKEEAAPHEQPTGTD